MNVGQCGSVIIRKVTDPASRSGQRAVRLHEVDHHRPVDAEHVHARPRPDARRTTACCSATATRSSRTSLPSGWDSRQHRLLRQLGRHAEHQRRARSRSTSTTRRTSLDCTYTNKRSRNDHRREDHRRRAGRVRLHVDHLPGGAVHPDDDQLRRGGRALRDVRQHADRHLRRCRDGAGGLEPGVLGCSDGSPISAIVLGVNETVTCTFHNARERGNLIVKKITDDGQGTFGYTSTTLDPKRST